MVFSFLTRRSKPSKIESPIAVPYYTPASIDADLHYLTAEELENTRGFIDFDAGDGKTIPVKLFTADWMGFREHRKVYDLICYANEVGELSDNCAIGRFRLDLCSLDVTKRWIEKQKEIDEQQKTGKKLNFDDYFHLHSEACKSLGRKQNGVHYVFPVKSTDLIPDIYTSNSDFYEDYLLRLQQEELSF